LTSSYRPVFLERNSLEIQKTIPNFEASNGSLKVKKIFSKMTLDMSPYSINSSFAHSQTAVTGWNKRF